ncbi:MAG: hypothetical protein IH996_05755 [Proteobacteria bacterium]|nr:hypothetical protein [Pseudomonadota bacterium]
MRLKTITARSMPEALDRLREEFGPDVLIIRSDESKSSVRVTVAFEGRRGTRHQARLDAEKRIPGRRPTFQDDQITEILDHHGVPFELAMRIQTAAAALDPGTLPASLAGALEICFRFRPLSLLDNHTLMFVGPYGAGKTLAAEKIAGEFPGTGGELRLIDSDGVNPLSLPEMKRLSQFVRDSGAEPILVLPAGIDPMEAAEAAQIFAALGARRMIASRLDTSRRLGSLFSAASSGDLIISALGQSPNPADRLEPATASGLAKLLIQLAPAGQAMTSRKKAV